MTRLDQIVSVILLGLGGLAVVSGVLTWSIPPIVSGGVLVLAALWFRRSLLHWAEHLANQRAVLTKMELHARILQRKEGERERKESEPKPRDAAERELVER